EPGIRRAPLETADELATDLVGAIFADLSLCKGDEVAVLINGLGSTSQMELYLLHRKTQHILADAGIKIAHSWVGEYATSLEMAGASITLMKLDDELRTLLYHPCRTPALIVGDVAANGASRQVRSPSAVTHREDEAAGQ